MPEWASITLIVIVQLVMLVGLIGSIIPLVPGPMIIWLGALGYGLISGFSTSGIIIFAVITLLMLAGSIADNIFMGAGARKGGAQWVNILVSLVAGIAGTLLFPPFGGLIAIPLVLLLLEYRRTRDLKASWKVITSLSAGYGLSFLVRFGVGVIMNALWWVWVLFG